MRVRVGEEELGVEARLELEDAVDGRQQLDQVVRRPVALRIGEVRVFTAPLELVEDRVLGRRGAKRIGMD